MKQRTAAILQDLSGFGKCALTVALPVLSAAGVSTSVIPTVLLSAHTGGLGDPSRRVLTEDMRAFAAHWKQLGLRFDALASGYFGAPEQAELAAEIFQALRAERSLVMVDPVMGDNGKRYSSCPEEMVPALRKLCACADIITPNLTEAAFLLGETYREGPYDRMYIEGLLSRLCGLGPRFVVLTGVWFSAGLLGAAGRDQAHDGVSYALSPQVEGSYHGTGDLFSAALLGGLLNNIDLKNSMQIAADYTSASIRRTHAAGGDERYGVDFESGLGGYIQSCTGQSCMRQETERLCS